jgi:hypothetical protein
MEGGCIGTVLTIRDETTAGSETNRFTLEFPTERITIRDLIRERVYQEVQDYNREKAHAGGTFRGLVQPTEAEVALNGYTVKPRPRNRLEIAVRQGVRSLL